MRHSKGMALISVLMFLTVVVALMGIYSLVTRTELQNVHASKNSFNGFNASEAGLNLRADMIKNEFVNYNFPSGVSPTSEQQCEQNPTAGSGDFACQNFSLGNNQVSTTYVTQSPNNPTEIIIPIGEPYANLTAAEYQFTATSVGKNEQNLKEANLDLTFNTRLIPLFQFLLFFNGDMELVEGGTIYLSGPIHSNKDIYFAQQAAYWINNPYTYFMGPISASGTMYRGAKFQTSCYGGSGGWDGGWNYDIYISNLADYVALPPCAGDRFPITNDQLQPFNGNVQQNVLPLTVPDVNTFQAFAVPDPSKPNTFTYWQRSDARFVLQLKPNGLPDTTNSPTGIQVVDVAGNVMTNATNKLNDPASCPGNMHTGGGLGLSVGAKGDWAGTPPYTTDAQLRLFRDYQIYPNIDNFETVLDVDMQNVLNCMHKFAGNFFGSGDINTTTDGGLVLFFTVNGPASNATQNNYAVRYSNGSLLQSNLAGAPLVKGLTTVTDQKAVLWGDYNANNATWIPAAVMSDSQFILSNTWTDAWSYTGIDWWNRFTGNNTLTIQAAILSGDMPSCGGDGITCEGSFNDFGGGYTGMFRFNETFYTDTSCSVQTPMVWNGSLVSLHAPYHDQTLEGPFDYFSSPWYAYAYDTRFNDPQKLPPLTPRAVYNKQVLFERNYN